MGSGSGEVARDGHEEVGIMSPDEARILSREMGYMTKGLENVEEELKVVATSIKEIASVCTANAVGLAKNSEEHIRIHEAISDFVTPSDCEEASSIIDSTIAEVRNDLSAHKESAHSVDTLAKKLVEKMNGDAPARGAKSLLMRIKDNVIAVSVIAASLGLLVAGGIKLSYFVVKVDETLTQSKAIATKQTKVINQKLANIQRAANKPRFIYVKVPVRPDAGVVPRRRHRQRRRTP